MVTNLAKLRKQPEKIQASRVMGIDCSTYSLAYTVFFNRRPETMGEIHFQGKDIYERIADAKRKVSKLADSLQVDYIVFEAAILAQTRNINVTISLSYMYGTCLSEFLARGVQGILVKPSEWQNAIGNKNYTKSQKDALKIEIPEKSPAWYKEEIRRRRKQFTADYFLKKWPELKFETDNMSDSCGLAYYGYKTLTKRGAA